MPVAAYSYSFTRGQFQFQAGGLGENLRVGENVPHHFVKRNNFAVEAYLTGVGLGEQRESIHDSREPPHFIQLTEQTVARRSCQVLFRERSFQFTVYHRQRSFQFVRGMQRELSDPLERTI